MLQELTEAVEPEFSDVALADDFAREQEHAELMRAELERDAMNDSDRDWAMTYLLAKLPADAYVQLQELRTVKRGCGRIEHTVEWVASAIAAADGAPVVSSHRCPTPAEAAMQCVERFLPRVGAEDRVNELGTIDPLTLAGLRRIIEAKLGRSDFLLCDDAGRVTVKGYLEPAELSELRGCVAGHNAAAKVRAA